MEYLSENDKKGEIILAVSLSDTQRSGYANSGTKQKHDVSEVTRRAL